MTFFCRGFTLEANNCSLHSADLASLGPEAMLSRAGAKYYERAPCLDRTSHFQNHKLLLTLILKCSSGVPKDWSLHACKLWSLSLAAFTSGASPTSATWLVREQGKQYLQLAAIAPNLETKGSVCLWWCSIVPFCREGVTGRWTSLVATETHSSRLSMGPLQCKESKCRDKMSVNHIFATEFLCSPFMGGAITVNSSSIHSGSMVRIIITDREGREASITEVGKELELRITSFNTGIILTPNQNHNYYGYWFFYY